jgi:predicted ATPase
MRVDAYSALGAQLAFTGDLVGGLEHLEKAISWFETRGYRTPRLQLGVDPRISCLTTSAFILWLIGYPDRAVDRATRAIALATEIDHPYSRAYALYHSGFLHHWRREPEVVRDRAARVLDVAEARDLPVWRALGRVLQGWVTSAFGDGERGLAEIDDGLALYQGLRTPPVFWPLVRFLHASACFEAARPADGLALLREAAEQSGSDAILSPLFHILRGDLLTATGGQDGAAPAAYVQAFEVASRYDERLPQLRALTRLIKLGGGGDGEGGDRQRHTTRLRQLYDTFAEGLSTPDLRDAAEILGRVEG